jgi:NADH-quinone oxidoreductase subunit L
MPKNPMLVSITVAVIVAAVANHLFGAKRSGGGIGAADHIHHAPVLSVIYEKAEKRWFDPYDLGLKVVGFISRIGWVFDRVIDWIYDGLTVGVTGALSLFISRLHNGSYTTYLLWSLLGSVLAVAYILMVK